MAEPPSTDDHARQARTRRTRRSRLGIALGVVVAVAVLVVALLLSLGGDDAEAPRGSAASSERVRVSVDGNGVRGVRETRAVLDGVPQDGTLLGDPDAPVTLYEFVDLQCTSCRDHELTNTPRVVGSLVRDGRLNVRLATQAFVGQDSVRLAAVASQVAKRDRLFDFVQLAYFNQGAENSGYATDAYLRRIAGATPDPSPADLDTPPEEVRAFLVRGRALATRARVRSTPAFALQRRGSDRLVPFVQEGTAPFAEELTARVSELERAG